MSPKVQPTETTELTLFFRFCDLHWYHSFYHLSNYYCLLLFFHQVKTYLKLSHFHHSACRKLCISDHGQLLLNLCFTLIGLYNHFHLRHSQPKRFRSLCCCGCYITIFLSSDIYGHGY